MAIVHQEGFVKAHPRLFTQTAILAVARDSDHLEVRAVPAKSDPLADRVFVRKQTPRHRPVDYGDGWRALSILCGEIPATQERNVQRHEIARPNVV